MELPRILLASRRQSVFASGYPASSPFSRKRSSNKEELGPLPKKRIRRPALGKPSERDRSFSSVGTGGISQPFDRGCRSGGRKIERANLPFAFAEAEDQTAFRGRTFRLSSTLGRTNRLS
jgi:hypothetical protein